MKEIKTDIGAKNGQTKCPKCGSTDISLHIKNGKLKCNYCSFEFAPIKLETMEKDISSLEDGIMGSGAKDIVSNANDIITFKCSSCGAEIAVDTSKSTSARCHWCRNILSINQQIPNGAVPDVVLPFKVTKEEAIEAIKKFVQKRKFFAHNRFKEEFTPDNVMGVYLPYMIVDLNIHANMRGEGKRKLEFPLGKRLYYVYLYRVEREFDLTIEGLSVESSEDKLNTISKNKTTNIINSIMPFDTENCVKWDSNYIRGYALEKRDTNISQLKDLVEKESIDIVKYTTNKTAEYYDEVNWDEQDLQLKGQQWKSAYLPVWIYSYQQKKKKKNLLHYVVVNARTKETMGSIPIHIPKLCMFSALVSILAYILGTTPFLIKSPNKYASLLYLFSGFIYFSIIYAKYRNKSARHIHEKETKTNLKNLRKVDDYLKTMIKREP